MELLNATKMPAGYAMGMRPDGRELLVVVVKGTFTIPAANRTAELAKQQVDLVMADEFTGVPGFSAPKYESDFAPFKPRCDVLLNGSAYTPAGRPTRRLQVGLHVGSMTKRFRVVGHREWRQVLFTTWRTWPKPFTMMPISYDNAYGGVDRINEKKLAFFLRNHAGCGYHPRRSKAARHRKPLPNTEQIGRAIRNPKGNYLPMAYGAIGRAWHPRAKYAGTYDKKWLEEVFPFLPADFNDRYYQAAPLDQQIDYLRGGEDVVLLNLTPEGHSNFRVPTISVPVTFYLKNGEEKETVAVNDTIIIEPDLNRFILLWRVALPLKKNMFEVAQVVAGKMPRAWYRARELGKTWYPSLKELVDERVSERSESAEEFVEGANP